ncbi:MAG TPA: DUF2259 domain-containing protein [Spirochaetales bacterium]|nr:DUF2259 domain-containing protein [Spirochaetales bacterium]
MRKLIALAALLVACAGMAFAGDVATLVNLGFSADSAYFMFGFHGLDTASGKPYAEIYLVDTKKNEFVPKGSFKGMYAVDLEPGWNPAGSFYKLFSEAVSMAKSLKIDHLSQGRLLYIQADGEAPDTLSFSDYKTADQWSVVLKEVVAGTEAVPVSSFGLEISIATSAGKTFSLKAGNPQIKRSGVQNYTISQILLAPDGKTVVVLVERLEKGASGTMIRYMVETFRLP